MSRARPAESAPESQAEPAAPAALALDPLIHEIPRLRMCAALAETEALESRALRELADVSDSALSKHLKRLAEAGYVEQKLGAPQGRGRPSTWVTLTPVGRAAFAGHIAALKGMLYSRRA
ncbi:transcriptional regulator [Micrococcales bacterium 31B]|nr:transcriptional regulator [Micrococcales bacterium 31B]